MWPSMFGDLRTISKVFHVCYPVKPWTMKDRSDTDLREAENIKKRWQKHTEELYKKDLNDLDNHDGVLPCLELDILEC